MIEPAFRIGDDGKYVLREQVDDALCQRRIARSGIAHSEEFVGEDTEIMERRRKGRSGNRRATDSMSGVVMHRHSQHDTRTRTATDPPDAQNAGSPEAADDTVRH